MEKRLQKLKMQSEKEKSLGWMGGWLAELVLYEIPQ
jgi:hypothetical protein